ncbi:unnamed protein product [Caenorhabditis auriculariae]|uniref:Mediator of RNA polymerase II transcription subunit 23 n=1 Tax=Caenorhabditis auriculariae TaxID=2777116 RepID=A0A8S1GPP4_9PELO|nr:unnamed protein product [Caenorhabditis auriculariae]
MDYKGIRSLSRYLMDPQFNRLPLTLSLEEVQQLSIIEEILLMIMDRDSNVIPSIFTMTEVNKGVAKQAYIFPRLAHALSQLCIYFRPVADLSHVVGRSFLFPLPQHPCFSSSAPSWRIDGTALHAHIPRFQHQFLPYRTEQSNSQTLFTHNRSHKFKAPYDVLLSVLICEVMAEAEQLPENEAIPRYQWENILSIIHQGIHLQILNIQHFLSVLRGLVKSANYTRARDEVMWIVLQITGTFSNTPRFEEALNEIIELYKVLFDGEVTWMGASDHIAQFVRFLAAACTWMLLEGKEGLPAPNESIKRQINFIAEGAEKIDSKDDAMLAVLANAYRSDTRVGRSVQIVFQQRLDSIPNDETLFQLSYGRHACNKITSFSSEFLDSLTLRAKGSVLGLCLGSLRNFTSERCPSPAVLDTLAKLISTLEYELGVKPLMNLLQRSLYISNTPNSVETAREQCHILYDFLCYRVPTISLDEVRSEFVIFSLSYLFNLPILQNHQLYCVIEHTVMRNWCWSTYSETIAIGFRHFSKPIQSSSRTTVFLYPGSFPTPSEGKQYPICPEIFRMYLISLMRAIKITGHEVSMDECYFAELVSTLGWPESMKHSFPDWALRSVNTGTNTIVSADLQKAVNTDYNLNLGMGAEHYMNYSQNQNENSPTILAVIFFHIIERRDNTLPLEFYKILQRKSARDIVIATNYLVDYVIAKIKDDLDNNESFSSISKALIEMVFRWHVVSADRLLLALVLHPTNDETSHIAMLLVHDFCTVKDFTDRVEYFHAHLPRKDHHSEYIRKLVDYHTVRFLKTYGG